MKNFAKIVCLLLVTVFVFSTLGCSVEKEEKLTEKYTEEPEKYTEKTEKKYEEAEEKIEYSSIEEAIGSIENVVSIQETERENPNYFSELKSYSLVYNTDNGTVEVFVLAPQNAITEKYGAIIWCPDARIADYRFADIAAEGYIVFAVYFRGYEGSQSEGTRDFGGDKDLNDLEVLLDIILKCDFINRFKIVTVSGVDSCIEASRLLTTEKGKEYISGAAFAQPLADYKDYYNSFDEEYKEALAEYITGGDTSKIDEEISKRNMLEFAENIGSMTELFIASFDEDEETAVPTSYAEALKNKFDELGVYYDEYHFDFPGTDFYVPESIGMLKEWLTQKFD